VLGKRADAWPPPERADTLPAAMGSSTGRRARWGAFGRTAIGIGIAAWVLSRVSFSASMLERAWVPLCVFAAIGPLGVLVEAARLRLVVRVEGIALSLGRAVRIVLVSAFFAVAVPGGTGGDVVKLYYLSRDRGEQLVEIGTLVLLDRAVAMTALFALVSALVASLPHTALDGRVGSLLAIGAALGVGLVGVGVLLVFAAERLAAQRLVRVGWIVRILTALSHLRRQRRLLLEMFGIAALGHASMLCAFAYAAAQLLGSTQHVLAAALAALGFAANAVPITPAGLGVGEAAFEQLFRWSGLPGAALLLVSWRLACLPIWISGFVVYLRGDPEQGRASKASVQGG
jgi:glycosyltransferase 2 family protein